MQNALDLEYSRVVTRQTLGAAWGRGREVISNRVRALPRSLTGLQPNVWLQLVVHVVIGLQSHAGHGRIRQQPQSTAAIASAHGRW